MTQDKCERAVQELQKSGFRASHVMGAPDDHGVWLDGVWNDDLQDAHSFRIHDEEIEWWGAETTGNDTTRTTFTPTNPLR